MVEAARRHDHPVVSIPTLDDGIHHGTLEVRVARTEAELHEAQCLRYSVFYGETVAQPTAEMRAVGRDFDRFDPACAHLLVIDHSIGGPQGTVVGTCRLQLRSSAERHCGFYTATEFDLSRLLAVDGEIVEVGRACVSEIYRSRPTMQLLWRGIATFVVQNGGKIMFGCGSLPGTDPQALARPLSYLHYNHLAPEAIRARALPDRYVRMDLLPPQDIDVEAAVAELSDRATLSALPPLIKGYLRLGGFIGDGAVVDPDFQTTDVCIIVATDALTEKYFNHFFRVAGMVR